MTEARPRRAALTAEEEDALQQAQRIGEMRRVRDAFLATFGVPGKRTPFGEIMLKHLEARSAWRRKEGICCMDANGQTDVFRTGVAEGRRWMMQAIHDAIEWRESDQHGNTSRPST
jgi:hypothetical protein